MVADNGIVASAARPAPRRIRLLAAAAPLALLAACGIKGPLYLPAPPAPAPAAQPAAAPAPPKTTGNVDDISRRNESISHTPLTR